MKKILNIPNRTLFLVMVGVVLFWVTVKCFSVYSNSFTGALYELFALPMLALPILLAALAICNLFRTKGIDRIWPVLSLVLFGIGVWWIVYN
jgi:hypothetical protein